jgi:hypothetical protein
MQGGILITQPPLQFYKCPHCGHILLKDRMMMSLAVTDAGFGIVGGGCPDCHQSLDAEAVYVTCKYDISVVEIVRGEDDNSVIQNILAAYRAGKVQLTVEELGMLSQKSSQTQRSAPPQTSHPFLFKRKDLAWIILLVLAVVAIVLLVILFTRPKPNEYGMPTVVESTVLNTSKVGSRIISAQTVTKNGLEMWCVITESQAGQQHWVVSGSIVDDSAVSMILESGMPSDFLNLGCTNWGGVSAAATSTITLSPVTSSVPTSAPVFYVPAYMVALPYDPSVWKVSPTNTSLSPWDVAPCLVEGPYTAWNEVPDRPADIQINDGNLFFEAYLKTSSERIDATYFIRGGVPGYDFSTKEPIVLYISSNPATWEACKADVDKLIEGFSSNP